MAVAMPGLRSTTNVRIRQRVCVKAWPAESETENAAVGVLVSASTEVLRLIAVGRASGGNVRESILPAPTSMDELLAKLEEDYANMYFITGDLADELYAEDCLFADPTISFEGLQLYKNNLQLLIPFLVSPAICLKGIRVIEPEASVLAAWTLSTRLELPWKPQIFVNGTTEYSIEDFRIVKHVERWDITPWQAVLMVLGLFKR